METDFMLFTQKKRSYEKKKMKLSNRQISYVYLFIKFYCIMCHFLPKLPKYVLF